MLLLLTVLAALAGPWTVSKIEVRADDLDGEWTPVDGTGEAYSVGPDGAQVPLRVNQQVDDHTRLVTQLAIVTLRREEDDRTIRLLEESDLTLEQWGVLQELGSVWYDVHGNFKVVYHRVEAMVEGTRFLVTTDEHGAGSVAVARGKVRVRTPQGEVLVRRGRISMVDPGHPPDRRRWRTAVTPGAGPGPLASATPIVGLLVGGRVASKARTAGDALGAQGVAGLRGTLPLGPVNLVSELGLASTGSAGFFPLSVGVQARVGPVTLGGSGHALVSVVEAPAAPGEQGAWTLDRDLGATLDLGFRYPLGERLGVDVLLQAGYIDGLTTTVQTGASWRF